MGLTLQNGAFRRGAGRRRLLLGAAVCALLPAMAGMAQAQDSAEGAAAAPIESVVVTARKRSESIQTVPMSISAVSGEDLTRAGDSTMRDIGAKFPGVSFNDSNGPGGEFSIRGVTSANSGSDTSIGLYIDDVFIGSEASIGERLFDLQSVQVLRGPQGTLFGRNTVAGAINVVTNKPTDTFGGEVQAEVGNHGLYQGGIALNVPLVDDQLFARGSFVYRTHDGYLKNTVDGSSGNEENGYSGRAQLLFTPTSRLNVLVSFDTSHDDACDNMFRIVSGLLYTGNTNPNQSAWDSTCSDKRDVNGGSVRVDYDLGWANFSSISAYRHVSIGFLTDRDFTATPIITTGASTDRDQFTQEFRLTSPDSGDFRWVAGAFYYNTDELNDTLATLGPGYLGPGNYDYVDATAKTKTWSLAGYGSAEYHFSPNWSAELGIRYTYEHRRLDYVQTATLPVPGFSPVPAFQDGVDGSEFSPAATVSYHWSPDTMAYVRVARGYKSGGFNTSISSNPAKIAFEPEFLTSYETGIKTSLFGGRALFNGTVYYLDYKDIQIASQTGAGFYIGNAASARSYGVETELTASLTDNLLVHGGLGYVNSRFDGGGANSGNHMRRAPQWTASLGLDYTHNVGTLGDVFFRPDVTYRGSNYVDDANTAQFIQKAHLEVNARAGIDLEGGWTVALWGRNLADRRYTLGGFAISPLGFYITQAPPRTFGIDVRKTF